jgi:hypothetical protein
MSAFNNGIAFINTTAGGKMASPQRTIFVAGPPRSGTSMAARVLAYLGVPMGVPVPAPIAAINYEDPEFVDLLHAKSPKDIDRKALSAACQNRDGMYAIWGFKVPFALNSLDILSLTLRNPHFVFMFRDPLAVANREYLAVSKPRINGVEDVISYYLSLMDFLKRTDAPCFLVSYEKAIQDPEQFVCTLAQFVGIESTRSVLAAAIRQIIANHPEYLQRVVDARAELHLGPVPESSRMRPK